MIAMNDIIALLNKLPVSDLFNIPVSPIRAKVVYEVDRVLVDCSISSQVGDRTGPKRDYKKYF